MNIQDAAASGGYVTIGSNTYHCTPLCLRDFALAQAYLKSKTPDPMEGIAEICKDLHVEVAKVLVKEAFAQRQKWGSLDTEDGLRWAASSDGLSFFLYQQTRQHHPEVTLEQLQQQCAELEGSIIQEVLAKLSDLSGLTKAPTQRATRKPLAKKRK